VDRHSQLVGAFEDGAERVRPFDRWDFDPPLSAIGETLSRTWQVVQIG
jgi:hypothetical protein